MRRKRYKQSLGGHLFDFGNGLLMVFLFIIMAYPFLYVFNYSISTTGFIGTSLLLLPRGINFESYKTLLNDADILRAFVVSAARALVGGCVTLGICGMAGYALSTTNLVCGRFLRLFFVFTMYFGAGTIPAYLFMKMYHLDGTFWVYIIPGACSVYYVILIKTYIESIAMEMREAVYVDGGNDFQAFTRVIFPVCKPVNATVFLFTMIGQWNAYMDTVLYNANKPKLYPLQYVLYTILSNNTSLERLKTMAKSGQSAAINSMSLKMAITIICVVPVMLLYPMLQKHFASGIMIGAVKN